MHCKHACGTSHLYCASHLYLHVALAERRRNHSACMHAKTAGTTGAALCLLSAMLPWRRCFAGVSVLQSRCNMLFVGLVLSVMQGCMTKCMATRCQLVSRMHAHRSSLMHNDILWPYTWSCAIRHDKEGSQATHKSQCHTSSCRLKIA